LRGPKYTVQPASVALMLNILLIPCCTQEVVVAAARGVVSTYVQISCFGIDTEAGTHSLTSRTAGAVAALPSGATSSPCELEASIMRAHTIFRARTA
ncbi:hypothetical protein C8R45DRAFT_1033695, partial [Mycena sanguinolenta]